MYLIQDMNQTSVLKKLLPGFIPLIIFFVADEVFNTRTALIISILTGLGEFIVIFIKTRKLDTFVLIDTALLTLMGGISIILENDIFFKLKPAIIEAIVAVIIGISVFTPRNLLLNMSKRYLRGIEISDFQISLFNRSLKVFFFIITGHILLIIYSSYYLSNEAWVFISGILFYILFGMFIAYEFVKNKMLARKYRHDEWLPLVDTEGNITGKAPRTLCHQGKGLLHPVVHLHVFNDKNELYLQKRPMDKKIQPGKWDTAVGGHISWGNTLEQGLYREVEEEIGLKNFNPVFVKKYVWETKYESELIFMFLAQTKQKITYNPDELADGKFWKIEEIKSSLGKDVFTPNFEHEFPILMEFLSPRP
ncbi:MAG: NUDIX domain-containing protein [Sphingobacteriales bacterium]|nr:NUDIX domain-containing protein [Sphingobacteriales bacterium]